MDNAPGLKLITGIVEANRRRYGKTHAMILSLGDAINDGNKVLVPWGKRNPKFILDRLAKLGIDAVAEPSFVYKPPKLIYDIDGNVVGVIGDEKKRTGYVFYKTV